MLYHTLHMIYYFKYILGIIGVMIILFGAIKSVLKFFNAVHTKQHPTIFNLIRQTFACYIVLGLEFLLASDIIMTIMAPDYYTLGILGGLVIIRTVMTLSLDRDIAHMK